MTRALLYRRFGRWQESYAQFVRASELNPHDLTAYIGAGGAAYPLRWWPEMDQIVEGVVRRFPRRVRFALMEEAVSLRLRGEVAVGTKKLEEIGLTMPAEFTPLFYISFWKHDYERCQRLLAEAAKYPELESERWDKEVQLVFVAKVPFDQQAAREAEQRLEERLRHLSNREEEGGLIITLSNIKILLGKKAEAIRIAEESIKRHPVSEDALVNTDRLKWLAYIYVYAGEHERALETFARLVRIPGGEYYGQLKNSPVLEGLRQDARFDEIVKQSQQPFPRL